MHSRNTAVEYLSAGTYNIYMRRVGHYIRLESGAETGDLDHRFHALE